MASTITGEMSTLIPMQVPVYTVATLPAAATYPGGMAYVTDAVATPITGLGLAPVGSGANIVKVWSTGSLWIIG